MNTFRVLEEEKEYWLYLNNPSMLAEERRKLFEKLHRATDQELVKYKQAHPTEALVIYSKRHLTQEWAKVETACRELNLHNIKGGNNDKM